MAILCAAPAPAVAGDPARWVDPFVGTRDMGHTFPGATVPFGMVQLSPDTRRVEMFDAGAGPQGHQEQCPSGRDRLDLSPAGWYTEGAPGILEETP